MTNIQREGYPITPAGNIAHLNVAVPGQRRLGATWDEASRLTHNVLSFQAQQRALAESSADTSPRHDFSIIPECPLDPSIADDIPPVEYFTTSDPASLSLLRFANEEDYEIPEDTVTPPLSQAEKDRRAVEVATNIAINPDYHDDEKAIDYMKTAMIEVQGMTQAQIHAIIVEARKKGISVRDALFEHFDRNITNRIVRELEGTEDIIKKLAAR